MRVASVVRVVGASVALLAIAVWLGGLVALGALAAPVVFGTVPFPASADAMTLVFRRFDLVAMACAAVLLATEAARALARVPFTWADHARAGVALAAAVLATVEGTYVSPAIAGLHAQGAIRGYGPQGLALSRWHDVAEALGKTELVLLVGVIVLHVLALARRTPAAEP